MRGSSVWLCVLICIEIEWRSADIYANSPFRRVALIDKCLGPRDWLSKFFDYTPASIYIYRRKNEDEANATKIYFYTPTWPKARQRAATVFGLCDNVNRQIPRLIRQFCSAYDHQ